MTENDLWALLSQMPEPKPVSYRLYYNEHGEVLFYSTEDVPGNYIEIDQQMYSLSPTNIRIVDGQIKVIKTATVLKLVPGGDVGTACRPTDVSIVVDASEPHTNWILK